MTSAVSINNVSKVFGAKHALDNVSLDIPSGHLFGFLGPNGAGKTTLIRCLMDFARPSSGTISVLGQDAQQDSARLKSQIGYLSSDSQLHTGWTGRTHIDFVASTKGGARATELSNKFDLDLDVKVGHLSSGNKQKLSIILAFMGNPKLLIMDEPTRGLDPLLQNELYDLLRRFTADGNSVFLSSHNLTEVQQLCDSIAVIKAGKIVASDTMQDILQKNTHIIRAVSTNNIDKTTFKRLGIEILNSNPKSLIAKTQGELDFVVKTLSKYPLTDLEVSHVSLEDIFMEYYEK